MNKTHMFIRTIIIIITITSNFLLEAASLVTSSPPASGTPATAAVTTPPAPPAAAAAPTPASAISTPVAPAVPTTPAATPPAPPATPAAVTTPASATPVTAAVATPPAPPVAATAPAPATSVAPAASPAASASLVSARGSAAGGSFSAAAQDALTKAMLEATPLFNATGESKISFFRMFFSLLTATSPAGKLKEAMQEFIKLVVTPVLKRTDITEQQVEEVSKMLNTALAQISVVDAAAEKPLTKLLSPLATALTARYNKIKATGESLAKTAAMPDGKLSEKITATARLISKVDADMLDSVRQGVIKGIEGLYAVAKKGAAKDLDAIKKLLPMIQANNCFTSDEKNNLSALLTGGSTAVVSPLAVAAEGGTAATPSIAALFKYIDTDSDKKPVPVDRKIQIIDEALRLIAGNSSTTTADKNQIRTSVNKLFVSYFSMNAIELSALQRLLGKLLDNTVIIAEPKQRALLEEWVKKLGLALGIAEADKPLLATVKTYRTTMPIDESKRLQALEIGLSFFVEGSVFQLPTAELDKKNTTSLVAVLTDLLRMVYEKRSGADAVLMARLENALRYAEQLGAKNALLKDSVQSSWLDNLALLNKIMAANAESRVIAKMQKILDAVKGLTRKISDFEIGLLVDAITNLYASRYSRAQLEIYELQRLIAELALPAYKGIFTDRINKMFAVWGKGLGVLSDLSSAASKEKLSESLALLGATEAAIVDSSMVDERAKFLAVLERGFMLRGFLTSDDLGRLSSFLKALQLKSNLFNLFNTGQQVYIAGWVKELDSLSVLLKAGSSGALLIDRLLMQDKDIVSLRHAFNLMGDNRIATPERKEALVRALKNCVANIGELDRVAVLELLQAVAAKKINGNPILLNKQLVEINRAIANLRPAV